MPQPFDIFTFHLESSTEVDTVVKKLSSVASEYNIVHIHAYIHNSVMVQSLKKAIEAKYPDAIIALIKIEKDAPTSVSLFTCKLCQKEEISLENELISQLSTQNSHLQNELANSRSTMLKRYFIDTLTNLPNLYQLRQDLSEIENATYILINIDNFKQISDFYGYIVGDYVLEQLAHVIIELDENIQAYKIDSNQFAIMLPQQMDFYTLKNYLQQLSDDLNHLTINYHKTVIYSEITLASASSRDHSDIFSKISMALNYALDMNLPFWIYEDRMNFEKMYENNLKLSLKIRRAVEQRNIVPYFQPIIDNITGKVIKFEALSRLIDEHGVILSPNEFLPITKKIKVYTLVTKTIIEKAFDTFMTIDEHIGVSINIAIEDIMNHEIYSFIIQKLQTSGIGHRVTFELLETEKIEDYRKVARFITEIKRYGATIAIDDFGSGFSNFIYLTKIDVDYIKIDGSLIEDIHINENSKLVTQTIVKFAKQLGIKTVAEYVHASSVLAQVKAIGVDYSQGYIIDKPKPEINTF